MGPQEDYIETVVTCEGDFHDPELHSRLEKIRLNLKELLSTDSNKVILKKVEPWNSVRVTFNITKEAALRLKLLAQQGNAALRSLGILAVQIEGDKIISLTIAGRNNERAELILKTSDLKRPGPSVPVLDSGLHSSDDLSSTGPSNVETTRKNIEEYLRKGTLFDTIFNPNQSLLGNEVFRSPNVVATSSEPIPFKANNILSTSHSAFHGTTTTQGSSFSNNFPPGRSPTGYPATHSPNLSPQTSSHSPVGQPGLKFPSPPRAAHGIHPTHQFQNLGLPPPPPYPHTMATVNNIPRQGKTVTSASPLLVNLLQTEPLVAGLSNISGQKMLPPNEGGSVAKKKRRPRKPKDPSKPGLSLDGEIPIESIPNPALDSSNSVSMTPGRVASPVQSGDTARIPYLPYQTNHAWGIKDNVHSMESDNVISDPFPPEVTAGKIVNPYTGKLEPIDKISDLSPKKAKPVGRLIDDSIMSEKLSCTVSDKSMGDIKLRIGPLRAKEHDRLLDSGKQSVAAMQTSTVTMQNTLPISYSHASINNSGHIYADNRSSNARSVAMDIYATEHSSHRVNSAVHMASVGQLHHDASSVPAVKLEAVAYTGGSSVPKSISKSSVMHTSYSSGNTVVQSNKPHNVVSSTISAPCSISSSLSSQENTNVVCSQGIQSRGKLDSLTSLNSPNVRNTDVHSITGSPNGKVSCEGDDGSNHSGIINDNPEGVASTVSPDSSANKVYNHDSGVGSSSERSDDTPSEPGDEFRATPQVHIEVSREECLKPLKYTSELKNAKVMTVGFVMNHEQTSSAHPDINSILNRDPLSKIGSKFEQFLCGQEQNELLSRHHPLLMKAEKEMHQNYNKDKRLTNGPSSMLNEHIKTDQMPKAKSPNFHPSVNNTLSVGAGLMKDMSMILKDNSISENGPTRPKSTEKKRGSNPQSRSNSPRQSGKEAEPPKLDMADRVSAHYTSNCNDWPDLSLASSIFGMNQINTDNFDSHHFEGLEFDSPPNSEKFAGFTEQDILQATAKGLAYKAQAALDGGKGSNITSKYSKRSSPVNVNMLNHLYAPGLPLPRRLTESVQRLVKPLPSNDHGLPHSRACKSPGSSKGSNGATSPRSSQGGARSPGVSVSRSASAGVGQNFTGQNSSNSATTQHNSVAGNLNHNQQMTCSSSTDSPYKTVTDGTYQAFTSTSATTTQDNYYQHHSKCVPSISTKHDPLEMATEMFINCVTSQDTQTFNVESVPSSVCNVSVGSDIGAGFHSRQDSISENIDVQLPINLCAMEQNISNDLSKSASEKTISTCGSISEPGREIVSPESCVRNPSVDLRVNKLPGEFVSDGTNVPPYVSSTFQHSTSNLSGSALTTQTSVSFSRQHGISLSSVDIAKTVPSTPNSNHNPVHNVSQDSNDLSNKPVCVKVPIVSEMNINNSHKNLLPVDKSDLCSNLARSPHSETDSVIHSQMIPSYSNCLETDVSELSEVNYVSDTSVSVPNCELFNHIDDTAVSNTITTTTVSPVLKELENTPSLVTSNEISPVTSVSEVPQRRLTRKRKSNNSESDCSDTKEIKITDDLIIGDNNDVHSIQSQNIMLASTDINITKDNFNSQENKLGSNMDEKCGTIVDDGMLDREDDLINKRGRKMKPLAPAPVIGFSFFDTPVIQGRTRSQSTTPANEKLEQKEDIPVATQKRSTRSLKQKDQSDAPANKQRRSRDHR